MGGVEWEDKSRDHLSRKACLFFSRSNCNIIFLFRRNYYPSCLIYGFYWISSRHSFDFRWYSRCLSGQGGCLKS